LPLSVKIDCHVASLLAMTSLTTPSSRSAEGAVAIPRHEHLALLCAATGRPKEFWIAHPKTPLMPAEKALLSRWTQARLSGYPLAYLVGWREFYGRRFWVNPSTLIPRADTELLIDTAKALVEHLGLQESPRLADLGTGSGCIAISLALEIPKAGVTATDRSEHALKTARNNAAWLGASERVSFALGSWWDAFDPQAAKFHGIVSNPPYIASGDPHLGLGDLRHEPSLALTPSSDQTSCSGLEAIETIAKRALDYLVPGGFLLVEHGFEQQESVLGIFKAAGLSETRGLRDLSGNPRAVIGFHAKA
jgi:release factor glutamine methyltransferase